MAQDKVLALLTVLLLLAGTGAAVSFDVSIGAVTDHELHWVQHRNTTDALQHINGTLENIGSIGCTYRLEAEFDHGETTFTRYSQPYQLHPGENEVARLYYVPLNHTGMVNTTLSVRYCDQKHQEASFSFNVTEREVLERNATVNATTLSAGEERASIRADVDGDLLVPREAPPYWKVSAAELEDGQATVEYDAPIFSESETLEYTVLNRTSGDVTGTVRVDLEERPPTIIERLRENAVLIALLISLLINLLVLGRKAGAWEKVKF